MNQLVNFTDLKEYKYIADSVRNEAIWPNFVIEAQNFDVKHWLGDQLLNELLTEYETGLLSVVNTLLLTGGSYNYQNKTYLFQGLKAAIIYYAFGRYTAKSAYNYTQAGITIKDTDFSTPAGDKAIQRLSTEALLTASSIKDETLLFLRRKSSDYPLFNCSSSKGRPRTFLVIGD